MIFEQAYRWIIRISFVISIVLFGLGVFFYARLPVKIPVQIGFNGDVNSWGSKITVFLFPALLLAVALISRSKYVDIKYPVNGGNRLHKLALCCCLILLCIGSAYFFFMYGKLLE